MHPEAPQEASPSRELDGPVARLSTALAIGLSLYALYWVLFIVQPQIYRVSFLLVALVLCFLLFPRVRGSQAGVTALDWMWIAASVAALAWPLIDFDTFVYRAAEPRAIDLLLGSDAERVGAGQPAHKLVQPLGVYLFDCAAVHRAEHSPGQGLEHLAPLEAHRLDASPGEPGADALENVAGRVTVTGVDD